jgi:hypothetical protein
MTDFPGNGSVKDWINSDELLDHLSPQDAFEFFRRDKAASVGVEIIIDFTIFLGMTMVTTQIVNGRSYMNKIMVRGFSCEERESIDLNTNMTVELYNAICASASRARMLRLFDTF